MYLNNILFLHIIDETDNIPAIPAVDGVDGLVRHWHPRAILRRTNWLHQIDALRVHDIREMNLLWEIASICLEQCNQFVLWVYVVKHVIDTSFDTVYQQHLKGVLDVIIDILQLLCSEGYYYYLDYMKIAFYSDTNCPNNFPEKFN